MKKAEALASLAALAQENRLDAFRILVRAGAEGAPAGQIAEKLGIAPNALTFHFDRLRHAGLVTVKRNGRSMVYAAHYPAMYALLAYLSENCCAGALPDSAAKTAKQARKSNPRNKHVSAE